MPEITADLVSLCQNAAAAQRKDSTVVPRFRIMPCEIKPIEMYIAAHFPDMRYQLEYPTGGANE